MNKTRLIISALLGVFALATFAPVAGAASLRYTFTGSGSGSLDHLGFVDRAFAIIGEADPVNAATCVVSNCRYLDFASALVRIEGVGEFAVTSTLRVFNTLGNLGLSRGGADGLDLFNVFKVAPDYDFASALGPIAAFASLLQWDASDVLTSGGVLAFDNADTDGTFKAEGVPLPASAWLLGTALLFVRRARRREVEVRLRPVR